jgi:hypothetical protein
MYSKAGFISGLFVYVALNYNKQTPFFKRTRSQDLTQMYVIRPKHVPAICNR